MTERISSTHNCRSRRETKTKKKRKTRRDDRGIPHLSGGLFTEVNCRILPEDRLGELAEEVYRFVQKQGSLNSSMIFSNFSVDRSSSSSLFSNCVQRIYLGDFDDDDEKEKEKELNSLNIIFYKTKVDRPLIDGMTGDEDEVPFGRRWCLPHQEFESLWETLEFDLPLKSQLMHYVFTVIRFAKAKIDRTVIHCNQTVLLYGPPGLLSLLFSSLLSDRV